MSHINVLVVGDNPEVLMDEAVCESDFFEYWSELSDNPFMPENEVNYLSGFQRVGDVEANAEVLSKQISYVVNGYIREVEFGNVESLLECVAGLAKLTPVRVVDANR